LETLVWVRDADGDTTGYFPESRDSILVNPGQPALIQIEADKQNISVFKEMKR
jgi:hypothetical protein